MKKKQSKLWYNNERKYAKPFIHRIYLVHKYLWLNASYSDSNRKYAHLLYFIIIISIVCILHGNDRRFYIFYWIKWKLVPCAFWTEITTTLLNIWKVFSRRLKFIFWLLEYWTSYECMLWLYFVHFQPMENTFPFYSSYSLNSSHMNWNFRICIHDVRTAND